jgi:TolB-like protein/tetratricopeptide (TPR) repeat protein
MTEEHGPEPADPGEAPAPKRALWSEIKEHKVIQWSVAYLGAALAVAQAQEIVSDVFGWPNAIDRIVIITLIVGFPIALTVAWYHGHRALRRISVGEFSILAVLVLVGALFFAIALPRHDAEPLAASPAPPAAVPIEPAPTPAATTAGTPLPNKIAVLPCDNLSSDPEDAHFASGLHQDIIWQLDKVGDLTPIPRVTVLRYAGSDLPVAAIAAELGARALLGCTVRYADSRVRITAELVDATGLQTLWQGDYEPSLVDVTDVFAVQADIAMNICEALSVVFTQRERELLAKPPTVSTEAYVLFLKANEETDYDSAIELYEEAVAADGEYAAPRAALAFLWATELINTNYAGAIPPDARAAHQAKVRDYAERALAIDPTVAYARSALTLTDMLNWRWTEAYERLVRARTLTPNDVTQYDIFLLSYLGRSEEATRVVERGQQLYPNDPDNWMWRGWAAGFAGQHAEAATAFAAVVAEAPGEQGLLARDWLARMEIARGNGAQALEQLRLAETISAAQRQALFLPMWAYAYGRLGEAADARRIFAEMEQREAAGTRFGTGGWALAQLAVGDEVRALEQLVLAAEKAAAHELDEGFFSLMALRANVTNDDVLRQRDFAAVLARIKGE